MKNTVGSLIGIALNLWIALGRIGMGNTCNSMADSCQCMTKPTEML